MWRDVRWRWMKVLWTAAWVRGTSGLSPALEALHLALASPDRLERILDPIILPSPGVMQVVDAAVEGRCAVGPRNHPSPIASARSPAPEGSKRGKRRVPIGRHRLSLRKLAKLIPVVAPLFAT